MGVQLAHQSHWRDDGTCSYCGSLSPQRFFDAIAAGARLGPTDKNYKVYVTVPNPIAGHRSIMGASNAKVQPSWGHGWVLVTEDNIATMPRQRLEPRLGEWVLLSDEPTTIEGKFYFQHLDEEQRCRFVELLNSKALNIGEPGYFYRLPFFVEGRPRKA